MVRLRVNQEKSRCEVRVQIGCVVCGHRETDAAHIKTRGSGGDNSNDNLLPLCRLHHHDQHKMGWERLCQLHPIVRHELKIRGWRLVDEFGQTKLRRIE